MTAGVMSAILILFAAAGLGRAVMRMAGAPERLRGEMPFAAAAMGLGALSLVGFFAGAAGAFYSEFAWGLVVVTAALFARDGWRVARESARAARRFAVSWRGAFEGALVAAFAVTAALCFVSSLAPPTETDALTLHLPIPREYIAAHRMLYIPDSWDSAMALGPHMLYTLAMLLTGSDRAPAVLHFLAGLVFALWVWQFARKRLGPRAAYPAATLLFVTPMMAHLVIAPMIDMFFALYAFAAFAWALEFARTRRAREIALAGVMGAFAAQVKFSGLVVLAAVFISAAAYAAAGRQRLAVSLRAIAAGGAIAAIVALPFFVRNYAWTGNPVFPTMKGVFGGAGWDAPAWQSAASGDERYAALRHSPANMLRAAWLVTTDAETASGGISELIGPAFLALAPLALLLRSRKGLFWRMAVYAFVAFALTYWLSPRPRARYFLSVLPIMAVYAGASLVLLKRYGAPALRIGQGAVLLSVATGLAVTGMYSVSFAKVVFGRTTEDAFLERSTDFYAEYRWMRDNLAAGSKVLVQATNDVYYSAHPTMRLDTSSAYTRCDSRECFGMGDGGTVETALERLAANGVTHLFVSASFVAPHAPSSASRILWEMKEAGLITEMRAGEATRGTRNPLQKQRVQEVAIYRINYRGGAQ